MWPNPIARIVRGEKEGELACAMYVRGFPLGPGGLSRRSLMFSRTWLFGGPVRWRVACGWSDLRG